MPEVSTACECAPHYRCTDPVTPRYATDGTVDKCEKCKADARDAERLRAGVQAIKAQLAYDKGLLASWDINVNAEARAITAGMASSLEWALRELGASGQE
jgi:hypothetical protein